MLGTIGTVLMLAIFGYGCIHLIARLNDFIEEQRRIKEQQKKFKIPSKK